MRVTVAEQLDRRLGRWVDAGLIDADTAERIRAFERARTGGGLGWPVRVALGFGGLLLGAGVLLFVSANWDRLSPASRMSLVVLLVGVFHAAGALARDRFESMSVAMHALGTLALGAGLALTGQIYHLEAKWSMGALLWAAGAGIAYALLRQWPQAALLALLVPDWLIAEWYKRVGGGDAEVAAGCAMLAFTYLSALAPGRSGAVRRSLAWIGGIALIPAVLFVTLSSYRRPDSWQLTAIGAAIALTLGLAVVLRGRQAIYNAGAVAWVILLMWTSAGHETVALHAWLAVGSVGLAAWGLAEQRAERVNLAVAGFACTVIAFYFSTLLDKIGRSASLIVLGIVFLAGGYGLERLRRRLVARIGEART
jgi:uncharacterized membrane protein